MRSASGPERLCPRCKGGEFRRGFSSVTGYWAGHLMVPVICSRCYYNVGFGIESSLPRFEPASGGTPQAAGRVHSPGPSREEGPRVVWSEGRVLRTVRPAAVRDWIVLGAAALIVVGIFFVFRSIGS